MTCFCGCLCELHNGMTCFFLEVRKKICEMACLLLSFGAGTNRFAVFFEDSVIFFLCDLTCLNFFEFILPKKKIQSKFDFIILRWINQKTPLFSETGCNIHQIQKIKYIQHWVFVQLSFILQQSQWQNLCVAIIEWLFFKTTKKQKIWASK